MVTTIYAVTGLTCEHCARAVTQELESPGDVRGVAVDLVPGGESQRRAPNSGLSSVGPARSLPTRRPATASRMRSPAGLWACRSRGGQRATARRGVSPDTTDFDMCLF